MANAAYAGKRRMLRDRRRNRGRLAAAFRHAASRGDFPDLGFGKYFQLADAICEAADNASDEDLDRFIADAVDQGDGSGFARFEEALGAAPDWITIITQLLPVILPLILNCFG